MTGQTESGRLHCLRCRTAYTPLEAFDLASVCWPQQCWLSFRCARCGAHAYLELSRHRVTIGDIDGAPGPCFMPGDSVAVPGLRWTATIDVGIRVVHAGWEWRFPAR